MLGARRAQDVCHVVKVGEQSQGAADVAPELDRAVLRQRPHEGRPKQPKFSQEELRRKKLFDTPSVQHGFGRECEPQKVEGVAKTQAEPRLMWHDLAVAIDNVRPILKRVARIEVEKFVLDRNMWVARGRDYVEEAEGAAEVRIKDGARDAVSRLRIAAQKEFRRLSVRSPRRS